MLLSVTAEEGNKPLYEPEWLCVGCSWQHESTIINEVRCYEAQIKESEKGWQPPGVEPRTPLA